MQLPTAVPANLPGSATLTTDPFGANVTLARPLPLGPSVFLQLDTEEAAEPRAAIEAPRFSGASGPEGSASAGAGFFGFGFSDSSGSVTDSSGSAGAGSSSGSAAGSAELGATGAAGSAAAGAGSGESFAFCLGGRRGSTFALLSSTASGKLSMLSPSPPLVLEAG